MLQESMAINFLEEKQILGNKNSFNAESTEREKLDFVSYQQRRLLTHDDET